MYTKNQINSIIDFFDANQELMKGFYKSLIKKGIPTNEEGYIVMDTTNVLRLLVLDTDVTLFTSYEKPIDSDLYERKKTYSRFCAGYDEKMIASGDINEIYVLKSGDECETRQCHNNTFDSIDVKEFYELTIEHIKNIQKELNIFANHFSVSAPNLKSISDYLTSDILNEQAPKKNTGMKLRDYGITTIIAAAYKHGNYVSLGATHSDCGRNEFPDEYIRYSDDIDEDNKIYTITESGYITSEGEFVLIEDALSLANIAGQIDQNAQVFTNYSGEFYNACKDEFDIPYAIQIIKENLRVQRLKKKNESDEILFIEKEDNTKIFKKQN